MQTRDGGRVVVGVSDTLAGYQALRYAVTEARERSVPLIAVRAFSCGANVPWRDVLVEAAQAEVRKVIGEALGCVPGDVVTEIAVREGPPGPVLTALADRHADILVIGGSSARRLLSGRRRAGVARHCARAAICPVVIVPPPELARGRSVPRLAREAAHEVDRYLTAPSGQPVTPPPPRRHRTADDSG